MCRKNRNEDDAVRKKRYTTVVAPGGHFFSNSASTGHNYYILHTYNEEGHARFYIEKHTYWE